MDVETVEAGFQPGARRDDRDLPPRFEEIDVADVRRGVAQDGERQQLLLRRAAGAGGAENRESGCGEDGGQREPPEETCTHEVCSFDRVVSLLCRSYATPNIVCGYLAVAVLAGLPGNAFLGWWWLDPIAALTIAALAIQEGRESWRGESCGCTTC